MKANKLTEGLLGFLAFNQKRLVAVLEAYVHIRHYFAGARKRRVPELMASI